MHWSTGKIPLTISVCVSVLSLAYVYYLRTALQAEDQKRKDERRGRIKAEQRLADIAPTETSSDDTFTFTRIGDVVSVYMKRFGTPRQPGLVETATALIKIRPELLNCLSDIEGYSHLWVTYVFHKNTNLAKTNSEGRPFDKVKGLISIPRVKNLRVGVFASRSPHRPNPIGLSLVKLIQVDRATGTLKVAGLDAVHGSPILDIKPYLPHVEAAASARVPGWVAGSYAQQAVLVQWQTPRELPCPVPAAWAWLSAEEVLRVLEETLSVSDPRSAHQKESKDPRWAGELCVAGFRARFALTLAGNTAEILEISRFEDSQAVEENDSSS